MKGMWFAVCILACLLVGSGCMTGGYTTDEPAAGTQPDSLALSKHDIIAMSRAKVGDDVIIKMIRTTNSYFQLKSRDVVELADSGVTDKVIEAMIKTADAPAGHAARYYAPYYPPYWWGAYPYYYSPWAFGFSVGYYAPYYNYHRPYPVPHYGYGVPRGHYTTHSYGGQQYPSGRSYSGGGRTINVARPSGHRR
jgi:hypothetical protein